VIKEFKDFLTKGDLIEIAVAFVMALAFVALVTSFVENVIMPIVTIPFGQPSFDSLQSTINGTDIPWGAFLTALVVFILTALAVFLFIVKPYEAYQRRHGISDEEDGPTDIELLTEIRDSLRNR